MQIEPHELRELLALPEAQRPFLLDVREPHEHARCCLPGAVLIPLRELTVRWQEVPQSREVVAYCHHGVRSLNAVGILAQAGVQARSLRGGIDLWAQVVDPKLPRY